jgi:hypothetical protein
VDLKDVPTSLEALRIPMLFAQRGQTRARLTRCRGNGAINFGTRQSLCWGGKKN